VAAGAGDLLRPGDELQRGFGEAFGVHGATLELECVHVKFLADGLRQLGPLPRLPPLRQRRRP
jgi:hypothetical protein